MTSLIERGGGVHEIVTLGDARGGGTEVGFTRERTILMDLAQTVRRTNAEMFDVSLCLCK